MHSNNNILQLHFAISHSRIKKQSALKGDKKWDIQNVLKQNIYLQYALIGSISPRYQMGQTEWSVHFSEINQQWPWGR